jgi:uncharacterized membrane protein
MLKTVFRWLAAAFFIAAGLNHFRTPAMYLSIMPPYLPWPSQLVAISGVTEVLGGIGLLIPMLRGAAAWGLIALLLAVLPANVQMALHGFGGMPIWLLWLRLPFQLVFMSWVYWTGLARSCSNNSPRL